MKTNVWFEKNPPKAETGVQNGVFLQRRCLPRTIKRLGCALFAADAAFANNGQGPFQNWKAALNRFTIRLDERMPQH